MKSVKVKILWGYSSLLILSVDRGWRFRPAKARYSAHISQKNNNGRAQTFEILLEFLYATFILYRPKALTWMPFSTYLPPSHYKRVSTGTCTGALLFSFFQRAISDSFLTWELESRTTLLSLKLNQPFLGDFCCRSFGWAPLLTELDDPPPTTLRHPGYGHFSIFPTNWISMDEGFPWPFQESIHASLPYGVRCS